MGAYDWLRDRMRDVWRVEHGWLALTAGHASTPGTGTLTACVNTASVLLLRCLHGNPLPVVESVLCSVQVFGEAQGLLYLTAMIQQLHTQSFSPQMEDFFVLCLFFFLFFSIFYFEVLIKKY